MEVDRKPPRRKIVKIDKVGEWGNLEYWHRLECGHVDIRKRESTATKLSCSACVLAEAKAEELKTLVVAPRPPEVIDIEDFLAEVDDHLVEVEAGLLRAGLAHELDIPAEAIDVVVSDVNGRLIVNSAVIFLSAKDAQRIAKIS